MVRRMQRLIRAVTEGDARAGDRLVRSVTGGPGGIEVLRVHDEYEQLKNEIRLFRNITLPTQRLERELFRELARHSKTRDVLNLESPQVSNRAHRKAARALERQRAQEEQEAQAAKNETSEAASSLALQDPR